MEYTPDTWVKVKIEVEGKPDLFKIVGGWSGGYADGDNWRVNSGVVKTEEFDDYYLFHGHSGSVYKCYKQSEGVRYSISGVLASMTKSKGAKVTVMGRKKSWTY